MRMRQMAGRAGRRKEGAVIFVPDLTRSIDRYYTDQPARLITQPPEVFVVDADNPYIARKHVVAAAANMSGGIKDEELKLFGRAADRMAAEAMQAGVLQRNGSSYTARAPARGGIWSVDRIRGNEQDPYVLCRAPDAERQRCGGACLETGKNRKENDERCEHFVQLLDRQYIYREAHPGAVFESAERGSLYRCLSLDDKRKVVIVAPLPDEARERTFPVEEVRVEILATREQRELANGAQLAWGDVKVTRSYAGYGAYDLIPRRRCRRCHATFPDGVKRCRSCGAATQPYFEHSQPAFRDFPAPHTGQVFTLEMETIACWLMLPAGLEDRLQAVAPCPIRSPDNRVAAFLRADPPFSSAASLARAAGIEPPEAEAAWEYYQRWAPVARQPPPAEDVALIHPAVYGQCLCHHLRRRAPEAQALAAFAQATGYPAVQDERHICRRCYGGVLLLAAHTLEHIVSLNYPIVAVGDSQDIGSTTTVLHPQTRQTTAMWFDAYEGGIGAAEKMYSHFELLIEKSRASLACKCQSDKGCPLCAELPKCDRDNAALSKVAAVGLAEALLGRGEYCPEEPLYLPRDAPEAGRARAEGAELAKGKVNRPGEADATAPDACQVLRVQKHVHDAVLARALEVRAEEAPLESPPLLIADLQAAYERVRAVPRPGDWRFDAAWTPHETLHVLPAASLRLTRSAYLTIVKAVHPDHNQDKAWATMATQAVNRAWEAIRIERQQKE
jgi:hypothetical protein